MLCSKKNPTYIIIVKLCTVCWIFFSDQLVRAAVIFALCLTSSFSNLIMPT